MRLRLAQMRQLGPESKDVFVSANSSFSVLKHWGCMRAASIRHGTIDYAALRLSSIRVPENLYLERAQRYVYNVQGPGTI